MTSDELWCLISSLMYSYVPNLTTEYVICRKMDADSPGYKPRTPVAAQTDETNEQVSSRAGADSAADVAAAADGRPDERQQD